MIEKCVLAQNIDTCIVKKKRIEFITHAVLKPVVI